MFKSNRDIRDLELAAERSARRQEAVHAGAAASLCGRSTIYIHYIYIIHILFGSQPLVQWSCGSVEFRLFLAESRRIGQYCSIYKPSTKYRHDTGSVADHLRVRENDW